MTMYDHETRDIYTAEFRESVNRLNQDFTKTINQYNRSELIDVVGFYQSGLVPTDKYAPYVIMCEFEETHKHIFQAMNAVWGENAPTVYKLLMLCCGRNGHGRTIITIAPDYRRIIMHQPEE